MNNLISAAQSALDELRRLHPPSVCLSPENCPTHRIISELDRELLNARMDEHTRFAQELIGNALTNERL